MGRQTPSQGFDYGGLVYYVYNQHLNEKLPRTTNQMYQSKKLRHIKQGELSKGDLVFFRIKTQDVSDHVGVYLGYGKFIEAPRTGANVRISKLTDNFWQSHYVGAKRAITEAALL
ncbi:C40 family peptidase [Serratia sp. UGAL515B_01]|uniref:C40 family peptidase n=1 Tax=Serratia sp. UGAL515B_01 TaxID=2986763 RepID=UPI0029541B61|nr:C40 family peptidase [Serratia sp. UGAL515B_01]WON76143.1 C40 family peptidase [Serratia sp. UGAL515B_01]